MEQAVLLDGDCLKFVNELEIVHSASNCEYSLYATSVNLVEILAVISVRHVERGMEPERFCAVQSFVQPKHYLLGVDSLSN